MEDPNNNKITKPNGVVYLVVGSLITLVAIFAIPVLFMMGLMAGMFGDSGVNTQVIILVCCMRVLLCVLPTITYVMIMSFLIRRYIKGSRLGAEPEKTEAEKAQIAKREENKTKNLKIVLLVVSILCMITIIVAGFLVM